MLDVKSTLGEPTQLRVPHVILPFLLIHTTIFVDGSLQFSLHHLLRADHYLFISGAVIVNACLHNTLRDFDSHLRIRVQETELMVLVNRENNLPFLRSLQAKL